MQAELIFITGTNTGTGKTLLTCLGLHHLRNTKQAAAGLKPFCSGSRSDAHHIRFHSGQTWNMNEINPWYFDPPLSPGAMPKRSQIPKDQVIKLIESMQEECSHLIVEGAGGIMSPLGSDYHFGDLIKHFNPAILLAASNKLGVLNQILLTHDYLKRAKRSAKLKIVLMGQKKEDLSSKSNAAVLRQWIPDCPVTEIPYLGPRAKSRASIQQNGHRLNRSLRILFGK
jgi:dethiobiotin synthetase